MKKKDEKKTDDNRKMYPVIPQPTRVDHAQLSSNNTSSGPLSTDGPNFSTSQRRRKHALQGSLSNKSSLLDILENQKKQNQKRMQKIWESGPRDTSKLLEDCRNKNRNLEARNDELREVNKRFVNVNKILNPDSNEKVLHAVSHSPSMVPEQDPEEALSECTMYTYSLTFEGTELLKTNERLLTQNLKLSKEKGADPTLVISTIDPDFLGRERGDKP